MDQVDPPAATHPAPPSAKLTAPPTWRRGMRGGLLGVIAAAAVATSLLALTALSATNTAAPAPAVAVAPDVKLAAAQQGAAMALQSLASGASPAAANAPAVAPATSGAVQVSIQNYAYSPASLTIAAGTTVVWTNKDSAPHTVTVSDGPVKFASPNLQLGDTFTYTFTQPGAYHYYCAVHPNMTASVTVTGSTTTPPTTTRTAPPPPPTTTSMPMPPTTTSMPMPPTTSMPMPPPSGNPACLVSGVLTPLLQHINSAHLGESPGQQVQDLLNLNQYVLTHTVLIQNMLNPLTNGGLVNVLNGILTPLTQHINSAHLGESPGQQAQDLLNVNQYVLTHTVLIQNMLQPLAQSAC